MNTNQIDTRVTEPPRTFISHVQVALWDWQAEVRVGEKRQHITGRAAANNCDTTFLKKNRTNSVMAQDSSLNITLHNCAVKGAELRSLVNAS